MTPVTRRTSPSSSPLTRRPRRLPRMVCRVRGGAAASAAGTHHATAQLVASGEPCSTRQRLLNGQFAELGHANLVGATPIHAWHARRRIFPQAQYPGIHPCHHGPASPDSPAMVWHICGMMIFIIAMASLATLLPSRSRRLAAHSAQQARACSTSQRDFADGWRMLDCSDVAESHVAF